MPEQELLTEAQKSKLLDLHIADYQAITTRCSYWITIQYAALTVLFVFLSVASVLWTSSLDRRLLFWGGGLILQVIGYLWMQTQGEQYTAILYIEGVLRPAVRTLVNTTQFWCYEPFLASIREPRRLDPVVSPELWELPIAALATIMVLGFAAVLRNPILSDKRGWLGFFVNFAFLIFQWMKTIEVRNIRLEFSKVARGSGCDFEGVRFPWRTNQKP